MSRLTDGARAHILKRLLDHRFAQADANMKKRVSDFAGRVYRAAFSSEARKLMAKLPAGWLDEAKYFEVKFGGEYTRLYMAEPARLPFNRRHTALAAFEATDELSIAYAAIDADRKALETEKSELKAKADSILHSATTVKRLLELWPELEPFVEQAPERVHQVPAVTISALNASFKLPVEKKRQQKAAA